MALSKARVARKVLASQKFASRLLSQPIMHQTMPVSLPSKRGQGMTTGSAHHAISPRHAHGTSSRARRQQHRYNPTRLTTMRSPPSGRNAPDAGGR
jgi:hypothetical protein